MIEQNFQFLNQETIEKYREMMNSDFFWSSWKPTIEVIDNAILVPASPFFDDAGNYKYRGGILDSGGTFVKSSGLYKDIDHKSEPLSMAECPTINPIECDIVDEEVIYYGLFFHHWGHFLFESTNRLWYYLQNNCKKRGIRLVALCLDQQKPDGNFLQFHELLGISQEDIIFINKPTQFKRITIPAASCMLQRNTLFTKEFLLPFDLIRDSQPYGKSSKIYLSRTSLLENNIIGEQAVENNFYRNGYRIITPETMSLKELIPIIKSAESVAGISGSNTHNLLFAEPNCKAIILNRLADVNKAQELVNQARGIKAVYVDIFNTYLPVTHGIGPFLVSVNENLFHYELTEGMKPYNLSLTISKETIVEFLRLWGELNHKNRFAIAALRHKGYELDNFVYQVYSFFSRNNRKKFKGGISQWELNYIISLSKIFNIQLNQVVDTDKNRLSDLNIIRYSFYFNEVWYKKNFMEGLSEIEPALHYFTIGFKEGFDPSARFSTLKYLIRYSDIAQSGFNPLWHFEKHGKFEGRVVDVPERNNMIRKLKLKFK